MPYTPSYANPLPTFQPAMRIIAGMTNANPMVITTTFAHQYETGLIVRLDIPPGFGMEQANQQVAEIIVLSPTTFSMPIDSTLYDPFVIPTDFPEFKQSPQVVPVGEENIQLKQATRNVLPFV